MLTSDFSYIELWLIDQNNKPLALEDKVNITLIIHLKKNEVFN